MTSPYVALERAVYRHFTRRTGSSPAYGYRPGIIFGLVRRCSAVRTLVACVRFRAVILVARGARLRVDRAASLVLAPGSVLTIGTEPMASRTTLVQVRPRGSLRISGIVTVMSGCHVGVNYDATVEIGDGTFLNAGTTLSCDRRVSIGRGCAVSWGVTITDTDVHTIVRSGVRRPNQAPVVIEDRVWIGTGATVLKGCTVGTGSVIAAGSVVAGSVPSGCLAAGSPATVVADDVGWEIS